MNYTVNLSDAEDKALSYVAYSQTEWIDNAVHDRCRIAIDDIVKICVEKCLEMGIQIPATKSEMVDLAFDQKWVVPARDRILPPAIEEDVNLNA